MPSVFETIDSPPASVKGHVCSPGEYTPPEFSFATEVTVESHLVEMLKERELFRDALYEITNVVDHGHGDSFDLEHARHRVNRMYDIAAKALGR